MRKAEEADKKMKKQEDDSQKPSGRMISPQKFERVAPADNTGLMAYLKHLFGL